MNFTQYKMLEYCEVFAVSLAAQKWEIRAVKARDELNDPSRKWEVHKGDWILL